MTQTEIERLQELRQKEQLTEKEFAQWEFFLAVEGRCYVAVEAKRQSEAVIQTSLFGTDGS